jgi:hypothetical protein
MRLSATQLSATGGYRRRAGLVNTIGTPGLKGFGVGICPSPPAGYTPLAGYNNPTHANYGNYQYSDGSVMVWVPAFRLRIGDASSPRFGVYGENAFDIAPINAHASEAAANAQGYYLHRAFIHAGAVQPGFFYDKYKCSHNGAGVASSIALGNPLVSGPQTGQVGFSVLTGAPTNAYHGAIPAARTRGAQFFPASVFMRDALAAISTAHGQAAAAATWCAWYDAAGVRNFPLGCNNNALKDANDATLTFTSAGASAQPMMPLTGSGSTLAKTTHNGQANGIADVNGTVWDISPGVTNAVTSKAITSATQANPVVLGVAAHGYTTGSVAFIASVGGMTQLNDRMYTITVIDPNTISLDGVNGSAFTAYTAGGTLRTARWYALKPAVDLTTVGSGASLATDLWGAAGIAALYDEITPAFATSYAGNNTAAQRYGNGGARVFGWGTAAERALSMAGFPAPGGFSTGGVNLFGQDYYYQYMVDQLCVRSGGDWANGVNAGVRARYLSNSRTNSHHYVGFVAASYLP